MATTAVATATATPVPAGRIDNAMGMVPVSMGEAMQLANMMATSKLVPPALQKSPADCLLVIMQAVRWQMDPFAVAQECSAPQGKIMHSGKLVAAVVNSRGNLSDRLSYSYAGTGDSRTIIVSGRLRGEAEARTVSVRLGDAKTANKVWQTQPDQQLMYHGVRVWARRHTPELMLGVYSPEEFDEAADTVAVAEAPAPRQNPHTTTAADIVDVPAPDDPDRVPAPPYPGVKELPKMQQRAVGERLDQDMMAIDNLEQLLKWKNLPETSSRLATLRPMWQDIFQGKLKERLNDLRSKRKMADDGLDIPASLDRRKQNGNDVPNDPTKFMAWANALCEAVTDPHLLEPTWNMRVDPYVECFQPHDQEEIMAIYRRHEQRLAP